MNSRRDFIQKMAYSAMGLTFLPGILSAQNKFFDLPGTEPVLRVAIMGLGSYANRVAEAMQSCKRAKITGLISGTPAKLTTW